MYGICKSYFDELKSFSNKRRIKFKIFKRRPGYTKDDIARSLERSQGGPEFRYIQALGRFKWSPEERPVVVYGSARECSG